MENVFCCGVIVFYEKWTVVVKTKKNFYSFPKGRKEVGETDIFTAFRELKEETNIESDNIELIYDILDERNENSPDVSVRYYIGKLKQKVALSFQDPNELVEVKYMKVEDVLKLSNRYIKPERKQLLEKAYDLMYPNIKLSKTLAWILRHGIVQENLKINENGYVLIEDLLKNKNFSHCTIDDIQNLVKNNDKQRFDIKDDIFIRAQEGHSETVGQLLNDEKMLTKITEALEFCIHDTKNVAFQKIQKDGLKRMKKKHLYFVDSEQKIRKQSNLVIYVDMQKAMDD